jgi:hypothetical protein
VIEVIDESCIISIGAKVIIITVGSLPSCSGQPALKFRYTKYPSVRMCAPLSIHPFGQSSSRNAPHPAHRLELMTWAPAAARRAVGKGQIIGDNG